MRTLDSLVECANRINIRREIELSFDDSSDEIVRLQKEQMISGLRSDDQPIHNIKTGSEFYSAQYAQYKGRDTPIDLKDKGDFQGAVFTRPESEGMFIDSDDVKAVDLEKRYGQQIFGLGTVAKEELAPIAGQKLVDNISNELDGNG